mmetsp:Transcript_83569/g.221722  ORF Transcript_83569/g.221722 Transcript_83569/m.221722 type:complete len:301 (+) Transcript_83569:28-930(+)
MCTFKEWGETGSATAPAQPQHAAAMHACLGFAPPSRHVHLQRMGTKRLSHSTPLRRLRDLPKDACVTAARSRSRGPGVPRGTRSSRRGQSHPGLGRARSCRQRKLRGVFGYKARSWPITLSLQQALPPQLQASGSSGLVRTATANRPLGQLLPLCSTPLLKRRASPGRRSGRSTTGLPTRGSRRLLLNSFTHFQPAMRAPAAPMSLLELHSRRICPLSWWLPRTNSTAWGACVTAIHMVIMSGLSAPSWCHPASSDLPPSSAPSRPQMGTPSILAPLARMASAAKAPMGPSRRSARTAPL